jgi:hypothetical protein
MCLEISCLLAAGCFSERIAERGIAVLALHFIINTLDRLVPVRHGALSTRLLARLAFRATRLARLAFSTTRLGHFFYWTHSKKMARAGFQPQFWELLPPSLLLVGASHWHPASDVLLAKVCWRYVTIVWSWVLGCSRRTDVPAATAALLALFQLYNTKLRRRCVKRLAS